MPTSVFIAIQVYCIAFLMGCDNMIDINLSKVSKSYGFDKVLNNINLTNIKIQIVPIMPRSIRLLTGVSLGLKGKKMRHKKHPFISPNE
mgnify:CR=1 FL=1